MNEELSSATAVYVISDDRAPKHDRLFSSIEKKSNEPFLNSYTNALKTQCLCGVENTVNSRCSFKKSFFVVMELRVFVRSSVGIERYLFTEEAFIYLQSLSTFL